MNNYRLFLDCDGVLAGFDAYCLKIFGYSFSEHEETNGSTQAWMDIMNHKDFFYKLPVLEDGRKLFEAVKHFRPIILTGVPIGNWAITQKLRWRDKHFPGTPMVTCRSKDKKDYCRPGDVLIDDTLKYRTLWEEAGGIFIHYENTKDALKELGKFTI